jgi:hypothetical protein
MVSPSAGVISPRRMACVTFSAALFTSSAVLIGGKFIRMHAPRRAGLTRSMQSRIALRSPLHRLRDAFAHQMGGVFVEKILPRLRLVRASFGPSLSQLIAGL